MLNCLHFRGLLLPASSCDLLLLLLLQCRRRQSNRPVKVCTPQSSEKNFDKPRSLVVALPNIARPRAPSCPKGWCTFNKRMAVQHSKVTDKVLDTVQGGKWCCMCPLTTTLRE